MKQKRKHILKKLLIFGIAVLLASCSEDLYETESNKSNYKVSYVNSVAIQNNKGLIKTLKDKRIIKSNTLNRIIFDTINNFSIDTDFVKFMQGPNFNSYTFQIIEQEDNYLDNLVLVSQAGAPYSAFIMRYNLTEQEKIALNTGQTIDFTNKVKVLKLSNSNITNDALGKLIYQEECNWVTSWQEVVTITPCPIDGCWEEEWTGTSISHVLVGSWVCTGTGSGGGGELGDVGTSPHGPGGGSDLNPPDPCKKLKNLFDPSKGNIKPTILNDLRPNIAVNPSGEKGYSLTKNSTGTIVGIPILPSSINVTQVPSGGYYFCAIHTHPLDTAPMFSFSDVLILNNLNNGCASFNDGMASFLLVCQDDNGVFQTYAIVFNPDSLNETIDQFMTNPENIGCTVKEISNMMNGKFKKEYDIEYNSPNPNYERVFLRNMFYSNVSLYKANSTLSNWSKLSLSNNSATATVNSTNCN